MTDHTAPPALDVVEVAWGTGDGAALVAELLEDLERRYDGWGRGDDQPEPDPDGAVERGPAPAAAAPGDPAWAIDERSVGRPHGCFLVARLAGRATGCAALRPLPGGPAGLAEVKRMYTVPEARGRGVARALLARLEEVAGELGYERAVLETGTAQPEALALYRSAGWSPVQPYGEHREHRASRCFARTIRSRPGARP